MAEFETITFEAADGIGIITMSRPGRRNAMTTQMLVEVHELLNKIAGDESVRVLILTGEGRDFCPGADIHRRAEGKARDVPSQPFHFHVATLLHEMPQVTIAAVNGACAGAGFGWACACDMRFASTNAMFNTAFLAVGVAGDMGGPWTLPRLVGAAKARELYFFPDKFDAQEALRIGLVARVWEEANFQSDVRKAAERLAASAPLALRALKENFVKAESVGLGDYIEFETERHGRLLASEDSREAFSAYAEKREPRFAGR